MTPGSLIPSMASAKSLKSFVAFLGFCVAYVAFLLWDTHTYHDAGRQGIVDKHLVNISRGDQPVGLVVGGSNGYFSISAAQLTAQRLERWYNASIINAGFTEKNFLAYLRELASHTDPQKVKTVVYASADLFYRGAVSTRLTLDAEVDGAEPLSLRPERSLMNHLRNAALGSPVQVVFPAPNRHGDFDFNTFKCPKDVELDMPEPDKLPLVADFVANSMVQIQAIFPNATIVYAVPPRFYESASHRARDLEYKTELLALLRQRLDALGPTVKYHLAAPSTFPDTGYMCDHYTHGNAQGREWRTADLISNLP